MRWRVRIESIEWDDGKGEYDVSDLPHSETVMVEADSKQAAIDAAMSALDQEHGSLIAAAHCSAALVRG